MHVNRMMKFWDLSLWEKSWKVREMEIVYLWEKKHGGEKGRRAFSSLNFT